MPRVVPLTLDRYTRLLQPAHVCHQAQNVRRIQPLFASSRNQALALQPLRKSVERVTRLLVFQKPLAKVHQARRMTGFDVASPSDDQPLVRLIQSTNVALSGYQSVAPVAKFLLVEGKASSGIKITRNDLTGVKSVVTLGQGCEDSAVREWDNLK